MDFTYRVAHYQRVHPPGQFLQWALFTTNRPLADRHRFTSARRFQCSPFTLALRNNRYERQSTGGFNQHLQLCSPKYRFTHKTPWEFRPQFSRCIISISLLLYALFNHPRLLIQVARVQKAQFSYRLDGLVP